MSRHLVLLAALATTGSLASAQPATTRLEAVSGVPVIDDKTQTEDVNFRTGHDDRMTVAVSLAGTGPIASSSTPALTERQCLGNS